MANYRCLTLIRVVIIIYSLFVIKASTTEQNGVSSAAAPTKLPKSDEKFRSVQLEVINAYKKRTIKKSWRCSLEDHVQAMSEFNGVNTTEEKMLSELLDDFQNDKAQAVIAGVAAIASNEKQHYDFIIMWDRVYINTLEYYNVLLGGSKYYHVGYGTEAPPSFFKLNSEDFLYYDLVRCLPFVDWIVQQRKDKLKRIFLVPATSHIQARNRLGGAAGLRVLSADLQQMIHTRRKIE